MNENPTMPPPQRRSISPKTVVVLILAALVGVFILQNRQSTTLTFISTDKSFPLWIVLLVTAVVGGILGQLVERSIRKERRE